MKFHLTITLSGLFYWSFSPAIVDEYKQAEICKQNKVAVNENRLLSILHAFLHCLNCKVI